MTLGEVVRLFFRFASPRLLTLSAVAAWVLRLLEGGWSRVDLVVTFAILALWPLQEWLLHVFVLHFRPFTIFGHRIDLLNARAHRKHHRDPWNLSLVFIPTFVFFYSIPVLWVGWHLLAPTPAIADIGLATYFTLSLHYEWAHYLAHIRYVPRSRYYRRLVRNHRRHHFKNERYWYGVSMLAGDWLLRTAPDYRTVPTSENVRSLGVEAEAA